MSSTTSGSTHPTSSTSAIQWPQLPRPVNWKQMAKGANSGVVGRKFCTRCGRWRHLVDFGVASRSTRGACLRLQAHCLTCQRVRNRLANGFKPRRVGQAPHRERLDRHNELYRKRLAENPALAAERQEYDRLWKEAKRRKAGIAPRNFRAPKDPLTSGKAIDATRFLEWLDRWANGREVGSGANEESIARLCEFAGVPDRAIRRVRESKRVTVALVDRMLVAAGADTALWEIVD